MKMRTSKMRKRESKMTKLIVKLFKPSFARMQLIMSWRKMLQQSSATNKKLLDKGRNNLQQQIRNCSHVKGISNLIHYLLFCHKLVWLDQKLFFEVLVHKN